MDDAHSDSIDSVEKLQAALAHWKNTTFAQHYLKLEDAMASFATPELRMVNARQEFAPRWVLCRPGTKKPATFWTAGVWRWGSNVDTGNFVPPGEVAPARLAEGRIQRVPNSLCQFSFSFDTTYDTALWDAQDVFEKYLDTVNGFNPHQKERREWQNGKGPRHSFIFSSQMFVKRTAYTRAKEASRSYELHPWIAAVTKKGMAYFPNNERPEMFEPDAAGGLHPLSECYPPTLRLGDLVWVSFSVEFFIGSRFWSTNFIPYEFVRVGTVALELLPEIRKEFDDDDIEAPRERLGAGLRGIAAENARTLDAHNAQIAGPSGGQQAANLRPPATPAENARNEYVFRPDDPERHRQLLRKNDLLRARTPPPLLDSDVDGRTESTRDDEGNETNEDSYYGTAWGGDESTVRDSMLVDDEASVEDDDEASVEDNDEASVEDNDEASVEDEDASSEGNDSFVVDDDAPLEVEPSVADDDTSVVARQGRGVSDDKLVEQPEADRKPAVPPKTHLVKKGKKRAASSERPPTEGGLVVGIRVLPDRRAKGKGVAR